MEPDLFGLDKAVFLWVYELPLPEVVVKGITHVSTRGGVWWLVAAYLIAFRRGLDRRTGLGILASFVAHVALVEGALKHLIARARPSDALPDIQLRDGFLLDPHSYSFPSGHATASFMVAFILGARFPRTRAPLFALAALVAISRVHLGCHYPSDVLAGAAVGILIGVGITLALGIMTDQEAALRSGSDDPNAPQAGVRGS